MGVIDTRRPTNIDLNQIENSIFKRFPAKTIPKLKFSIFIYLELQRCKQLEKKM